MKKGGQTVSERLATQKRLRELKEKSPAEFFEDFFQCTSCFLIFKRKRKARAFRRCGNCRRWETRRALKRKYWMNHEKKKAPEKPNWPPSLRPGSVKAAGDFEEPAELPTDLPIKKKPLLPIKKKPLIPSRLNFSQAQKYGPMRTPAEKYFKYAFTMVKNQNKKLKKQLSREQKLNKKIKKALIDLSSP